MSLPENGASGPASGVRLVPLAHQWIVGICSIVFDIDVGQRVEHSVPAGCLSPEEKQDVAFHSFPDSMSMELHARTSIKDSTFFFRIKRRGTPEAAAAAEAAGARGSTGGSPPVSAGVAGAGEGAGGSELLHDQARFLYGFVFCRQRQDPSLRRGGEQVSVVVLAEHPLSAALVPLSAVAGHAYFGAPGSAAPLQQVYDEVLRWPPPVAGPQLQLPVGFTALSARLPAWATLPAPSTTTAPEQYGANSLPYLHRGSSSRSLGAGGSSRRLAAGAGGTEDGGGGGGGVSRASSGYYGPLSPAGSNPALAGLGSPPMHGSGPGGLPGWLSSAGGSLVGPGAGAAGAAGAGGSLGTGSPVFMSAGGAGAGAGGPSPFSSGGGQQQAIRQLLAVLPDGPLDSGSGLAQVGSVQVGPPAVQQLERRTSTSGAAGAEAGAGAGEGGQQPGTGSAATSPLPRKANGDANGGSGGGGGGVGASSLVSGSSVAVAAGLAELSLNAGLGLGLGLGRGNSAGSGQQGSGLGAAGAGGGGGGAASREGSLQHVAGLLEGCAPAALPSPPPSAARAEGGLQHQRSRTSIQVPSRAASQAGTTGGYSTAGGYGTAGGAGGHDDLPPPPPPLLPPGLGGGSVGGGARMHTQGSDGVGDDAVGPSNGRGPQQQVFRRHSHALAPPAAGSNGELAGAGAAGGGAGGAAVGPVHGAFHEVDVYTPLCGHLPRLWQLWELALLGRPLLLVAPTPGEASAGVAALLALLAPLPYSADFRPYYCIHDSSFGRLAAGALPGPAGEGRDVPTLLGVTNLYFVRALPHWPNVLSIGKREGAAGAGGAAGAAPAGAGALAASVFSANAAVQALRQRTQGAAVLLSGHTEALWSAYKPLCRADGGLLGRLLRPAPGDVKSKVARIAFVNSDNIRRHFAELTSAFLSPFSRYFEPGPDGRVPGWNSEEFLFRLRSAGAGAGAGADGLPQALLDRVGSASAAVELYARFTASLNFAAWFAARRRHVAHLIRPPPGGAGGGGGGSGGAGGGEGGMASWFSSAAKHLDEVKLIGLFFSTEQQLTEAQAEAAAPDAGEEAAATVSRLQRELLLLFFESGMPEELQLTCISSPARAALVGQLPGLSAAQADRLQQLVAVLQGG
ncbi:hypothetical protein CHLRE_14g633500v5 [Chlamydomonas reinhardtii]|uniref:UDENN domain-containing protein n=1 Tax=Chlamydomonas reinhardtii TaxID=3055 RepID=A0A2K3CYX7_CHLRE|nr:uncharacterized protein CHLRE_14g633500v5 [Chlamydomonas reinhardtii]PNW73482.1 hypothetical protein CHLRE_14g633500v5 [Chlamydomonas reinhardtii]